MPSLKFGPPGFPSFVSPSVPQDCQWTLFAPSDGHQIRIDYFDLPASTDCTSHSLTIYDGLNDQAPQLAKLCGNICGEQVIRMNGRFAFVRLHIESPTAFRGFQAIIEEIRT